MSQKVFRTGNSLAVTIPVDFARSVGVRPGDLVRTSSRTEKGQLIFVFSGVKQLALLGGYLNKEKSTNKKNEKI